MDFQEVFRFMERGSLGVLATTTSFGQPQAALMGFAVRPNLRLSSTLCAARGNTLT